MTLQPLLDKLAQCEQDAASRAERLRAEVEGLSANLRETERQLVQLQITRKTVLALADGLTEEPVQQPEMPD
ncbi:hypothetical protein ACFV2N_28545 [Streptomyces sp. NPDC059680]|uniref:hypothetical protein n=1 Tax=Streptomyces sp. NPDC059680 TaxID=3346904 RepID=UPI003684475C